MAAVSPPVSHDTQLRAVLAACGAELERDDYGPQARFADPAARAGTVTSLERLAEGAVTLLPDLGVLAVTGEEATRFLHAQTTNDVARQPAQAARWHGLCTPKGRLLATLLGWSDGAAWHLALSRPLAEAIRKRLTMFVLRAKVRVEDRSDACIVLGLSGTRVQSALASLGLAVPGVLEVAHGVADQAAAGKARPAGSEGALTVIGLPAIAASGAADAPQIARWLLVSSVDALPGWWARLSDRLQTVDSTSWRWTEIRSGVARIVPGTVEQFVPQMIDFDSIGGVSFDKGCYPGQEIVARSHYLGKVKRRLFLAHLPASEPAPGSDVLNEAGEPAGKVVLAAPSPRGGTDLLLEAHTEMARSVQLQIDGRALALEPLPGTAVRG